LSWNFCFTLPIVSLSRRRSCSILCFM
jgi:hypothetical protein